MTGYGISKALGIVPAKVYPVLRQMGSAGFLRPVPGRPGSTRYELADEDLLRLLSRRTRIATAKEWFSSAKTKKREEAIERARRLRLPPLSGRPRPSDLPNYREFIRTREKDFIVRKVVARRRRSR
jgi:sugar-specific transcriptional regulator TrmB